MLKEEQNLAWRKLVKGIFESKAKIANEALEAPKMDLPVDGAEDPVDAPPVADDTAPEAPPEGLSGEEGEQEESLSITITADCLLALFEYFQADENGDENDSLDIDGDEGMGAESIAGSQPEMSMPASGLGIGMESEGNDVMPEPVAAVQPGEGTVDGGDDIAGSDATLTDTPPEEGSDELTPEQVVQKLIDLSADKQEGEPLDVDCLSTVFSPEEGSGEELGDGSDLATNTEEIPGEEEPALPASTGKQSVGPMAEDSSNSSGGELERKHRALASLEARLKSASAEDASDIRDDIAAVKSQIAKLKTKGITTAQGHKHSADAKATHKDDPSA